MKNRTFRSVGHFGWRASVMAVASSLVLAGAPQMAKAAGLGRLVVFSALGQPLKAEVEVSATRQELADMNVRLAPPEAFKQAGLDYATTLLSMRFNLEKRADGSAVIQLSSERPINDPFIDVLLELNWPTGRLVREYTFLLDPPEYAARTPAAAPAVAAPTVVAPAAAVAAPAPLDAPRTVVTAPGESATINSKVRARAIAQIQGDAAQKPAPSSPAGEEREVKRGDTLHRIATEMKLEGISLDQMLVGLFRANPRAFDGKNMNRLRVGAIISMPERSAFDSTSAREARKIVVAQSSNWNAYRSRLAGAASASAKSGATGQRSSGTITAKVDDPAERTAPQDQLKVAKAGSGSGSGAASAKGADEDLIAKERALREANERVALLEKNVANIQRLLELKDQRLAELEKLVAGAKPAEFPMPVSAATVPPAAPEAVSPTLSSSLTLSSSPTPVPAPGTAPAVQPAAPAPEAAPAANVEPPSPPPAKPAPPKPAPPKPKPVPPPPPEPSFFEELFGNTMLLAGGGAVLALIAGFLFWRRRRAIAAAEQELSSTLSPESTTSVMDESSVFHNTTGGQSVDMSSQGRGVQTDFSQVGPGSIDTDEVDPVAEADVYMAYGRDAQAEEILLEARQKDPKRTAIAVKLLEVYSSRKDVKQFETLATDLYGETGGVGADWEKAAAMGRLLDPDNPLFRGAASSKAVGGGAVRTGPTNNAPSISAAATASAKAPPQIGTFEPNRAGNAAPDLVPSVSLADIRLPEEPIPPTPKGEVQDLDFDIGTKIASPGAALDEAEAKAQQTGDIDFDLDAVTLIPQDYDKPGDDAAFVETDVQANQPVLEDDAVEFDVSLTESTVLGHQPPEPASSFDMASIDLDLQSPELEIADIEDPSPAASVAKAPAEREARQDTLVSTAINPNLSTAHMETVITPPEPVPQNQSDTAPNLDFAVEPMETQGIPNEPAQTEAVFNFEPADQHAGTVVTAQPGAAEQEPAPEPDTGASEEIATKLDLAKAYEDMGDIEGARELLQEILKEGNASQRETAKSALARLGG